MTPSPIFAIKIGGQAGQGIKSAGLLLAKVATRSGYHIHTYTEFPSLIKGGHNVTQILVSRDEVTAPLFQTDLLIALNQDTLDKHLHELAPGAGLIFDSDKKLDTSKAGPEVNLYPIPLSRLATAATGGQELLVNTVAVAAVVTLLGADISTFTDLLRSEFAAKGESVVTSNLAAAESGSAYIRDQFHDQLLTQLTPLSGGSPQMVVDGTEAVALGAIAGGLQFAAIYPMSPISNILQVLAAYQEQYGFIYKQPEDEISAINMAIGASFAGARSLTATSGGGFCLMSEGLGLAAMTETPLVIIEGMRPGPATGLPTWSGQGDLQFVLHAHQSDFPRIVLAAADARDAFHLTMQAFNLADKYQTPVILLVDKNICDDDHSYPFFDFSGYELSRGKLTTDFNPDFARFHPEPDGVSYRTLPGTGNFFIANSDEHTAAGFSTEDITDIRQQQAKRLAKLAACAGADMPAPQLIGPADAEVTLISWGSTRGSILHALKSFPQVNFLHLTWMSPFPTEAVTAILRRVKHPIDIECNATAQLAGLIAEKTGIMISDTLLKYDGRPIFPEEIITKLNSILSTNPNN